MRPALWVACACSAALGCDRSESPTPAPASQELPPSASVGRLPEAFLLRFETTTGTATLADGWELEILQIGTDIHVRGSYRLAGARVPVLHPMGEEEFLELWNWTRAFPLDRLDLVEDNGQEPTGWHKRLKYDAVLGPDRREISENEWVRPPRDAPWLAELESRLHGMVLEHAGQALESPPEESETAEAPPGPPDPADSALPPGTP